MCVYIYAYIHIYIYICCRVKTGPIFAFSSVKNRSKFFFVFENLVLPAEEDFSTKKKKKQNKRPISSVKNWSNFVAQHTWTSFER